MGWKGVFKEDLEMAAQSGTGNGLLVAIPGAAAYCFKMLRLAAACLVLGSRSSNYLVFPAIVTFLGALSARLCELLGSASPAAA